MNTTQSTLAYCQKADRRYEADTNAETECPYCRSEAAEVRAEQAESERDASRQQTQTIREMINAYPEHDVIEAVRRVVAERDDLRRQFEQAQAALLKIHDQAYRASLVQDRSVHLIKQICASISIDAKDAVHIPIDEAQP